jgi:hypothetical protein
MWFRDPWAMPTAIAFHAFSVIKRAPTARDVKAWGIALGN